MNNTPAPKPAHQSPVKPVRKELTMDADLSAALAECAARLDESEAQFIRKAIKERIARQEVS